MSECLPRLAGYPTLALASLSRILPSRGAAGSFLAALTLCLPATTSVAAGSTQAAAPTAVLNASTDGYHERANDHYKGHRRTSPPRTGRFIYGHWTPYTPPDPASLPRDVQTHVIKGGDTLYDISKKYYGDALLWPALWDANSWVRDPHWIYPGDTLLLAPMNVLPPGQLAPPVASLPNIGDAFYPAGWLHAARCGHYIADPNDITFGEIIDQERDPAPMEIVQDDIVYINVGAKDGVLPGDEFAVVTPFDNFAPSTTQREREVHEVIHPRTNKKLGVAVQMTGRLKVVLLGDAISTARITEACDGIEIGYDISPFTERPMPLARRTLPTQQHVNSLPERGRGCVVYLPDTSSAAWPGSLVSIDLGSDQGVIPGDVFQVYRNGPYRFLDSNEDHLGTWQDEREGRESLKRRREPDELDTFWRQRRIPEGPPRIIGELVVLYTERDTATANVTKGGSEILPGDLIVYQSVEDALASLATAGP